MEPGTYLATDVLSEDLKDEIIDEARAAGFDFDYDAEVLIRVPIEPAENARGAAAPPYGVGDELEGDEEELMGDVHEIRYRHVVDGQDYVHRFGENVQIFAGGDGTASISHRGKRPIWAEFE